ncbi:MAG: PD-(D/E)XK nuclease family protein, partial [Gammaproteobacteria bacterium]|nr:PD-(D/E)XK nuclease family protein [Gammaproteobacteria bacterium]
KITYIDKIRSFLGNEYTAFGTAIHTVCESKLLKSGSDPFEEFKAEFISEIAKLPTEVELNEKLIIDMGKQAKNIIPNIDPEFEKYFGNCEIISTEEQLMEPIGETGYNFKGYIDAVVKTEDGKYHIIDWKSCSWGWDARKRSDPMITYQLTLYKIFFAQKHNLDLNDIETHFALLKRTAKKDQVEIFRVTSGNKKMQNAKSLLDKALYNIDNKNFIKDRRSCAKCEFCKTEHCP